ncbi:MAG TPA: HepT-like ribonuclease domain-containing protein [Thermoanaerobaculia bacterium]
MLDAAETALTFLNGRVRADLDNDQMLLFAMVRALEIIGEAASKVTEEYRARTPGIDWDAIIGMRHRIVHAYFELDLNIVWTTTTEDLPPLIRELRAILT